MPLARLEHPKDGRADLVLAHPERRNATSIGLLEEAIRLIQGVDKDRSVLVIRGEGPHFCSGIDLDEVLESTETCFRLLRLLSQFMRAVRRVPAITIAPVQGGYWWWIWPFVCLRFCDRHAKYQSGLSPD